MKNAIIIGAIVLSSTTLRANCSDLPPIVNKHFTVTKTEKLMKNRMIFTDVTDEDIESLRIELNQDVEIIRYRLKVLDSQGNYRKVRVVTITVETTFHPKLVE